MATPTSPNKDPDPLIVLRLYVYGQSPHSVQARANLEWMTQHHLHGRCHVELVDVLEEPLRALEDGILVTPTLLKVAPLPSRQIIGDLSDREAVLLTLGIERGAS